MNLKDRTNLFYNLTKIYNAYIEKDTKYYQNK